MVKLWLRIANAMAYINVEFYNWTKQKTQVRITVIVVW